jgi:hypothetical protein
VGWQVSDLDHFIQPGVSHPQPVPFADQFPERLAARSSPWVRNTRGPDAAKAPRRRNKSIRPA